MSVVFYSVIIVYTVFVYLWIVPHTIVLVTHLQVCGMCVRMYVTICPIPNYMLSF